MQEKEKRYRVAVTGGRDISNMELIEMLIDCLPDNTTLISGCSSGADFLCVIADKKRGLAIEIMPALWSKYSEAAEPIRNQKMVDSADALIAFAGAGNTDFCTRRAKRKGIPVSNPRLKHMSL